MSLLLQSVTLSQHMPIGGSLRLQQGKDMQFLYGIWEPVYCSKLLVAQAGYACRQAAGLCPLPAYSRLAVVQLQCGNV